MLLLDCGTLSAELVESTSVPSGSRFTETLPFYLKHYPVPEGRELMGKKLDWKPMPENTDVNITRLGTMHGRSVLAVRYLPGRKPMKARDGARAVMILAGNRGRWINWNRSTFSTGRGTKCFGILR